MNNFQTILVAIFLAFLVFGVLVFAGIIDIGGSKDSNIKGKVIIWGTFNESGIDEILDEIKGGNDKLTLNYVKKEGESYQDELIKAFATGKGPDLFFVTPGMLLENDSFIYKIPYQSYPEKNFREAFIDGAEIFLGKDGIEAFPTVIDPVVMYYNKTILANEGLTMPPVYWSDLFNLSTTLTKKENSGVINQSMIALGQYENINHVKNILSMLFIQNGNPIVSKSDDSFEATLSGGSGMSYTKSAKESIEFFNQFSNQNNSAYSWNRSLPNSFDMFVSGKVAFYLGMASDLFKIQRANPNLSFDVTSVPQIKNSSSKKTYGEIYALAVSKKSANPTLAIDIATKMLEVDYAKKLSNYLSLPLTLRTVLAERPKDPYLFTFYNSAIIAKSWRDPSPIETNKIFKNMIEGILSNKYGVEESLSRTGEQINSLINN